MKLADSDLPWIINRALEAVDLGGLALLETRNTLSIMKSSLKKPRRGGHTARRIAQALCHELAFEIDVGSAGDEATEIFINIIMHYNYINCNYKVLK